MKIPDRLPGLATFSQQVRLLLIALLLWIGLGLGLTPLGWCGQYFSEEVTSPSIEVIHGWKDTIAGVEISITSSSQGSIMVPMEIKSNNCGSAEMSLTSGRTVPIGTMDQCTINVFPLLDKLINQEVAGFRVLIGGQVMDIPVTDDDRLILARVGNQSRQAFVLFQKELTRVLDLFRQAGASPTPTSATTPLATAPQLTAGPQTPATPALAPSPTPPFIPITPLPLPAGVEPRSTTTFPSPAGLPPLTSPTAPAIAAPSAANPENFVIVGTIQEERLGAGSRLWVEAINRGQVVVLSAQAKFDFYQNNQIIDTRISAFVPSDVPPGQKAKAEVIKTESNWDRVTVNFQWQR